MLCCSAPWVFVALPLPLSPNAELPGGSISSAHLAHLRSMSYTSTVFSNGLSGQHAYTQHRGPYGQQHQHNTHVPPAGHPTLAAHTSAPSSSSTSSSSSAATSSTAATANQSLLPTVSLSSLLGPTNPPPTPAAVFSFYSPPSADTVDTYTRYFAQCRTRELTGHRKHIRCVRWNSSGTQLASGCGDGTVRVYTLQPATPPATGVVLQSADGVELKGHSNSAEFVCFNPSRPEQLASASLDATLKIWDTNSQQRTTHDYSTTRSTFRSAIQSSAATH